MNEMVDELNATYEAVLKAAVKLIEAPLVAAEEQREEATDAAMKEFKRRMDLFTASCDDADELIRSAMARLQIEHMAELGSPALDGERRQG
ncbi:hypothetical protein J5N97_029027 [Dioscorea zingiberensis]|uniref:Uncharacterized protein n=1 Tax=Dioscorea zingiberensis TaxID=325984 RepID=A0A9D5BZW7_9LILI|nr:hypothetical protein J5N97_029027 [Dioscorea zingiberensis]